MKSTKGKAHHAAKHTDAHEDWATIHIREHWRWFAHAIVTVVCYVCPHSLNLCSQHIHMGRSWP